MLWRQKAAGRLPCRPAARLTPPPEEWKWVGGESAREAFLWVDRSAAVKSKNPIWAQTALAAVPEPFALSVRTSEAAGKDTVGIRAEFFPHFPQ